MNAFALGNLMGVIVIVALVPAMVGGLLRRKTAPSGGWIAAAWALALILALAGYVGSGVLWTAALALALLAALTFMRYAAWRGR